MSDNQHFSGTVDHLADTETVHICTVREDGSEAVTPIWSVVVDGVPYIRNGYGASSKWASRVARTGRATFAAGEARLPVSLTPVRDDEPLNQRNDDAYRQKYASHGLALDMAVHGPGRRATLRVGPA